MDGNGNLPKLPGFVARHEKNVKAFTQYLSPSKREIVRFLQASETCQSGTVKLGLGILIPPAASGANWSSAHLRNQGKPKPNGRQPILAAALGPVKVLC